MLFLLETLYQISMLPAACNFGGARGVLNS